MLYKNVFEKTVEILMLKVNVEVQLNISCWEHKSLYI